MAAEVRPGGIFTRVLGVKMLLSDLGQPGDMLVASGVPVLARIRNSHVSPKGLHDEWYLVCLRSQNKSEASDL